MSSRQNTLVNFIARGEEPDTWRMVLVEEGPWEGAMQANLGRMQERLYGCIDAVLDGELAKKFPKTKGANITIELDCYNLPKAEISEFFNKFSQGVFSLPDYHDALRSNKFAKNINFKISFDAIH
jgi:hypothetical protein